MEEAPNKLVEAFRLFLQGMGYGKCLSKLVLIIAICILCGGYT